MKAKTKFLKMCRELPKKTRRQLIYAPYSQNPMSLSVIYMEVLFDTPLGLLILSDLGYKDD
jgi:hypothetical protein